ncbi:MAG TPA: P-II family nitrogen regulator [Nitrososphaeraceae archaeon]|nr:P-II family nitrogen regulator [Nitrososphaeraceae archaeon]
MHVYSGRENSRRIIADNNNDNNNNDYDNKQIEIYICLYPVKKFLLHRTTASHLMCSSASMVQEQQDDEKNIRIEAFIISEKIDSVLSSLESLDIQATFYESKGMGKGEKETVRSGRGTGTIKMPYSTRRTVVTIVDENKVQETILAIKESATTWKANAGIIVVSPVEEIISI